MIGSPPARLTLQLGVLLLCLIWGSTWLVIREGLESLPPLTACSVRFLLAGAMAALWQLAGRERAAAPTARTRCRWSPATP